MFVGVLRIPSGKVVVGLLSLAGFTIPVCLLYFDLDLMVRFLSVPTDEE